MPRTRELTQTEQRRRETCSVPCGPKGSRQRGRCISSRRTSRTRRRRARAGCEPDTRERRAATRLQGSPHALLPPFLSPAVGERRKERPRNPLPVPRSKPEAPLRRDRPRLQRTSMQEDALPNRRLEKPTGRLADRPSGHRGERPGRRALAPPARGQVPRERTCTGRFLRWPDARPRDNGTRRRRGPGPARGASPAEAPRTAGGNRVAMRIRFPRPRGRWRRRPERGEGTAPVGSWHPARKGNRARQPRQQRGGPNGVKEEIRFHDQ